MMSLDDEDDFFYESRSRSRGFLSKIPLIRNLDPKHRKYAIAFIILVVLLLAVVLPIVIASKHKDDDDDHMNVIFMISDGFGPASETMARVVLTSERNPTANISAKTVPTAKLLLDQYLRGTVSTYSSSSYVTDSAAGATAYSCAKKTYNAAVGVDSAGKPCGTLLEAAKAKGKKTGLVVTSRITHATPASFSSHSVHRDFEEFIAKQQIDLQVDVMFGGGAKFYTNRSDEIDLFNYAENNKGYRVVKDLSGFNQISSTPVVGIFARDHLNYEVDRNPSEQPSLAQMTEKALSLLKDHKKGFFLLVEGSRIDMAAHMNDPVGHYRDILAYNDALRVIVDFVDKHPNTIVVSVSDHETGGLTLGRASANMYEWHPEVVWKGKASAEKITQLIKADNASTITELFNTYYSIELNTTEYDQIWNAWNITSHIDPLDPLTNGTDPYLIEKAVGEVVSKRAVIGWTTWGHSGVDINLYATGTDSDKLLGNYENTEIGDFIEDLADLDLDDETEN